MTKIVAISDMHGQLPDDLPACDVLVIGGDICPDFLRGYANGATRQAYWLDTAFREWLWAQEAEAIVGIAGNHDFVLENWGLVPGGLPWTYLQDSGIAVCGKKFWGTPWVPNLPSWAFYGSPGALQARSDLVPADVDVLITHGPPYGTLDYVHGQHVGEEAILRAIRDQRPGKVVCGHIHSAHGQADLHYSEVFNVSILDEAYEVAYSYTEINL